MKSFSANPFAASKTRSSTKALKPLLLALASLALSAVALPAAAGTAWWSAAPQVVLGTATINVRTQGALGDGVHNDTAAFQAAVNALPATGGTVYVPAGRYMIDATKAVSLRSHTRLWMANGAELDVIPNSASRYHVIKVWNVTDVRIVGGSIVGDRAQHLGSTGEWGYGINISGATNVVVMGVHISNCWGDGVLIGDMKYVRSSYVTVNGVVSDNNRRQGLTIGPAHHIYIVNSTFKNSIGTLPEAGIDIEPQTQGPVNAVRIENSVFSGNHGNGIELHANISDIVMNHNTMTNNRGFGVLAISAPYLTITANNATKNGLAGVGLSGSTHDSLVDSNALTYNSTRYMSPTVAGGGLTRDLQVGTSTAAIQVSNNTYSPHK
jgi:hypothetical protein